MGITLTKVTWYSKVAAAVCFIVFPLLAFRFGTWYQEVVSATDVEFSGNEYQAITRHLEQIKTTQQLNIADCAILVELSKSDQKEEEANYFSKNKLQTKVLETNFVEVKFKNFDTLSLWKQKIQDDKIGQVSSINSNCD
ncbi:MAG TPA: hypothetical protein VJ065_00575 [Patescibacteria group bacterium]|nr:hypothetical protein [Patescibacteria group bacterium]